MTTNKTQWAQQGDNWMPVSATVPCLKPGFYTAIPTMFGIALQLRTPKHDKIVSTGLAASVAANIDAFLKNTETYGRFGFLHKRGVLMTGKPGCGKSITAQLVCQHIINNGGIAMQLMDPEYLPHFTSMLATIREMHPDLVICNLMEDVENYWNENRSGITALLDGETQIDNIVHLATTNHPEQLDATFLNRPGRFDEVIWVEGPDEQTRRDYLLAILPKDVDEGIVEDLAKQSKGLFLSHMRELIASVFVYNRSVDESIAIIRKMVSDSEGNDTKKKASLPPALSQLVGLLTRA